MIALVLMSCGNSNPIKNNNELVTVTPIENEVAATSSKKTILCFGDSITAGYGLEDSDDAFPSLLQNKLDSLELDYVVINSGLSGETSAGGKNRIKWVLNKDIDIFLLELGANDGLVSTASLMIGVAAARAGEHGHQRHSTPGYRSLPVNSFRASSPSR